MKKALLLVLLLSACIDDKPYPQLWGAELNPYMAAHGYTVATDGVTILKNGYPVWKDEPCYGRGCYGSNVSLVPSELSEGVRLDFLKAYEESRKEYVADISEKIAVEPVISKPEVEK
jgi:hypothetical protein